MSVYDKLDVDGSFSAPEVPTPDLTPTGGPVSAAMERFRSCRWRKTAENGLPACCSHRDVLPLTGANGFDPEAWCPECSFYKLRRTPKKRDYFADQYLSPLPVGRATRHDPAQLVVHELPRQVHPFPVRCEFPVATPVASRLLGLAELLEGHGEVEVRVRVVAS